MRDLGLRCRAGMRMLCILCATVSWPAAVLAQSGGAVRSQPTAYNWIGLYVGAHVGYAVGGTEADFLLGDPPADISLGGGLYGGHLGYNMRFGPALVGLEGSFTGTGITGSSGCLTVFTCEREVEWLATVAARFGYVADRAMFYAMGGVAWSELTTTVSLGACTCLVGSDINVGWLVGFGVEYALTPRIAGRIEYVHVDLGSRTQTLEPPGGGFSEPARVAGTLDTLRLGASLKLGD